MSKIDNFPYPTPIPAKIWERSLRCRSVMLGSTESEKVRLISHEIIFAELPTYMTTIAQRHRQTDGPTTSTDAFEVWWERLLHCEFPGDCASETIPKIGQFLMKLCVKYRGLGLPSSGPLCTHYCATYSTDWHATTRYGML